MPPLLTEQLRLFDDGILPTDAATERQAARLRRGWRVMARERRAVPSDFAVRLTPRQKEAADLAYARWSPSDIAEELNICAESAGRLLTSVYAAAELEGGRGTSKQRQFIAKMERFVAELAQPVAMPATQTQPLFQIVNQQAS